MSNMEPSAAFLVLGASGGIGSQVARDLVAAGHRVFLASRPSDRLREIATELSAPFAELNATRIAEVEAVFSKAKESLGELNGAVHCVGSVLLKPAHLTTEAEWQGVLDTNLTSSFAVVRGAVATMPDGGSVVLMASAAARIGLANHEAIAAAKAGIIGLAQSAAASYARRRLRFNVVAPGLVKTPMTKSIWSSERAAETSLNMHALRSLGEPSDISSMIVWLLDPRNRWVTGQVFSIDGGLSSVKSLK
jgi:3-oxoacyl-[acyl-carrier protein] reductase